MAIEGAIPTPDRPSASTPPTRPRGPSPFSAWIRRHPGVLPLIVAVVLGLVLPVLFGELAERDVPLAIGGRRVSLLNVVWLGLAAALSVVIVWARVSIGRDLTEGVRQLLAGAQAASAPRPAAGAAPDTPALGAAIVRGLLNLALLLIAQSMFRSPLVVVAGAWAPKAWIDGAFVALVVLVALLMLVGLHRVSRPLTEYLVWAGLDHVVPTAGFAGRTLPASAPPRAMTSRPAPTPAPPRPAEPTVVSRGGATTPAGSAEATAAAGAAEATVAAPSSGEATALARSAAPAPSATEATLLAPSAPAASLGEATVLASRQAPAAALGPAALPPRQAPPAAPTADATMAAPPVASLAPAEATMAAPIEPDEVTPPAEEMALAEPPAPETEATLPEPPAPSSQPAPEPEPPARTGEPARMHAADPVVAELPPAVGPDATTGQTAEGSERGGTLDRSVVIPSDAERESVRGSEESVTPAHVGLARETDSSLALGMTAGPASPSYRRRQLGGMPATTPEEPAAEAIPADAGRPRSGEQPPAPETPAPASAETAPAAPPASTGAPPSPPAAQPEPAPQPTRPAIRWSARRFPTSPAPAPPRSAPSPDTTSGRAAPPGPAAMPPARPASAPTPAPGPAPAPRPGGTRWSERTFVPRPRPAMDQTMAPTPEADQTIAPAAEGADQTGVPGEEPEPEAPPKPPAGDEVADGDGSCSGGG